MGNVGNRNLVFKCLSQTKIQDLDLTLWSDLHIGGFQVTMDDAFLMGSFHSFSDLAAYLQGFLNWHRAFGNTLSQGFTWDQLTQTPKTVPSAC